LAYAHLRTPWTRGGRRSRLALSKTTTAAEGTRGESNERGSFGGGSLAANSSLGSSIVHIWVKGRLARKNSIREDAGSPGASSLKTIPPQTKRLFLWTSLLQADRLDYDLS
jgi:hypothetical protein